MKYSKLTVCILLFVLLVPVYADPNTWDIPVEMDTYISESEPNVNHGTDGVLVVREKFGGTLERSTLMQWDLRGLADANVQSAELWAWPSSATTSLYLDIYPVLEAWDEGFITWNERDVNTPWTTLGGEIGSSTTQAFWNTFIGAYKCILSVGYPSGGVLDQNFTDLVQSWIDNPNSNHGILIKRPVSSGNREGSLASRETGNGPYLRITCTNCSGYVAGPYVCGEGGTAYLDYDFNNDCYVNFSDLALFIEDWLKCTDPADPVCDQYWR